MSKYYGMCDLLKSHEKEENFCEIDYCPRVLAEDEMRLLLNYLADKMRTYADDLQQFLNNSEFDEIKVYDYFYLYYRRIDIYLYWANIHLKQIKENA